MNLWPKNCFHWSLCCCHLCRSAEASQILIKTESSTHRVRALCRCIQLLLTGSGVQPFGCHSWPSVPTQFSDLSRGMLLLGCTGICTVRCKNGVWLLQLLTIIYFLLWYRMWLLELGKWLTLWTTRMTAVLQQGNSTNVTFLICLCRPKAYNRHDNSARIVEHHIKILIPKPSIFRE